ncbi:MAG: 2-isopropylmalate synthase [Chloroflexota bacterium]|nr:2-isopropylmalate synthase [Chloroflexota bacterium]
MNDKVLIFDTTLRDGEQSAGTAMTVEEKVEIAKQLERLGVDVIEAGFPISSKGDFEAVQSVAREVRAPIVAALSHCRDAAIDRAAEALKDAAHPRIHLFLSSSDNHLMNQLRKNREEVVEMAVSAIRRARSYVDDVEFSPMDSSRTDRDFLAHLVRAAIDAGATTINIPDTVGYAAPGEFAALLEHLREQAPELGESVRLSVHCHDDLGMAVANSLAAVKAGARQVEGCINGIGERAGNCALEEVIMALRTRSDYFGADTDVDTKQLYATSRLVSQITGFAVQPNKAIVGRNAFRHASGIHQDGLIKDRSTYEIIDPVSVGVPRSELVLSKLSGSRGLRARLTELGYAVTDEQLPAVYEQFKELADKKREVTDRDLMALMSGHVSAIEQTYSLEHVQVTCGTREVPTATVTIKAADGGALYTDAATGDGPVDAVYKAINRIVREPNQLTEFSVNAVTEGNDAVGEVSIRIERDGRTYIGRGADTDIIVASGKAYMAALNRLLAMGGQAAPAAEAAATVG